MYTITGSLELEIIFRSYIGLADMHLSTVYGSSYPQEPAEFVELVHYGSESRLSERIVPNRTGC